MTFPPDIFQTYSLKKHAWGNHITRILAASLAAVDPVGLVKRSLKVEGNQLRAGHLSLNLREYERVFLVSIGKASFPMTVSAGKILTNNISQGIVLSKFKGEMPSDWKGQNITKLIGGHPIPTQESFDSTNEIKKMLRRCL